MVQRKIEYVSKKEANLIEDEIRERAIQSTVVIQREKRRQKEVMKHIKCVGKLSSALRMKNGGRLFSKMKQSLG